MKLYQILIKPPECMSYPNERLSFRNPNQLVGSASLARLRIITCLTTIDVYQIIEHYIHFLIDSALLLG